MVPIFCSHQVVVSICEDHKVVPLFEADVNFFPSMNGVMGLANGQRTLTYLRILTEFVSQDQYKDVVGM